MYIYKDVEYDMSHFPPFYLDATIFVEQYDKNILLFQFALSADFMRTFFKPEESEGELVVAEMCRNMLP